VTTVVLAVPWVSMVVKLAWYLALRTSDPWFPWTIGLVTVVPLGIISHLAPSFLDLWRFLTASWSTLCLASWLFCKSVLLAAWAVVYYDLDWSNELVCSQERVRYSHLLVTQPLPQHAWIGIISLSWTLLWIPLRLLRLERSPLLVRLLYALVPILGTFALAPWWVVRPHSWIYALLIRPLGGFIGNCSSWQQRLGPLMFVVLVYGHCWTQITRDELDRTVDDIFNLLCSSLEGEECSNRYMLHTL